MAKKPSSVEEYLNGLSEERRQAVEAIRSVILKNLPKGFEEGIQYGMIGYFVPHSIFPDGYHCDRTQPLPFAHIASQKNHVGIYLFCVYMDSELETWFREEWAKTGLKLDMGKSCVRFKKLENIPLPLIGKVIKKVPVKKFISVYQSSLQNPGGKNAKKGTTKTAVKKTATKKAITKKAATKKKSAATKKSSTKKAPAKKAVATKKTTTKRSRAKTSTTSAAKKSVVKKSPTPKKAATKKASPKPTRRKKA